MGSIIGPGPSLVNFFLGYKEEHNIFTKAEKRPKLYVRYVDDINAVFHENVSFNNFLNPINSQHPNIKFTVEERNNNILSFLDTRIRLVGERFESCVFRKSTNTDVLLNFSAICPSSWKKGVILGALNRAKVTCSSSELFSKEVSKLKSMFLRNGYSGTFFDRVVTSFQQRQSAGTAYWPS